MRRNLVASSAHDGALLAEAIRRISNGGRLKKPTSLGNLMGRRERVGWDLFLKAVNSWP